MPVYRYSYLGGDLIDAGEYKNWMSLPPFEAKDEDDARVKVRGNPTMKMFADLGGFIVEEKLEQGVMVYKRSEELVHEFYSIKEILPVR